MLQALPLPINLPAFARAAFAEPGLRFMLSIARQYPGRGYTCAELVAAGHAAAVAAALRSSEAQWQRFGAWWVRQGVLAAMEAAEIIQGGDIT